MLKHMGGVSGADAKARISRADNARPRVERRLRITPAIYAGGSAKANTDKILPRAPRRDELDLARATQSISSDSRCFLSPWSFDLQKLRPPSHTTQVPERGCRE